MKVLVVVSCVLAVAAATPGLVGAPLAYAAPYASHYAAPYAAHYAAPYAAPYAAAAVVAPTVTSQFHAQDELGQYSYGYQGDTSAKQEVRTADGITRGGYSYLDANGIVQSASYVSDPVNGFRVAATNLPVGPAAPAAPLAAAPVVAHAAPVAVGAPLPVADTPEVVAAKAAHFQAHAVAKAALLGRKKRSPGLIAAPVAPVAAYHAPAAVHAYAAPAAYAYAAPAIVAPVRSFGYSSVTAHPGQIVAAAHPGAVVIA